MFNAIKEKAGKLFSAKVIVPCAVAMAAVQSHAYDISGLDSVASVLGSVQDKAESDLVPALVGLVVVSVVIAAVAWFARKGKPKG